MEGRFLGSIVLHLHLLIVTAALLGSLRPFTTAESTGVVNFPTLSSKFYGKIKDIRHSIIDDKNRRVTIAAVDYIIQLDLDSLSVLHSVHIPTEKNALDSCIVSSPKELCRNFFEVLLFDPEGRIFACGTNGGKPKCWRFNRTTLELIPELSISGVGRCPRNPKDNVTNIFQGGYLFSATPLGSNKYTIFKAKASKSISPIRTHQSELVFNEPRFVSSYYLGKGFVYFFFREVAIENSERRVVYSRVARVCQYDKGEPLLSEDRFTSFLKSQLECVDKSGSVPIYFDELQSTFLLEVHTKSGPETFVYGVFTTSSEVVGSSAICRYKVKDIEKLFENSLYSSKTADNRWVAVSHPSDYPDIGRPNCTKSLDTTKYDYRSAVFAMKHPLLYDDVKPFDGQSIFVLPGAGLTSLVVEDIHFNADSSDVGIHIIFAGSADGVVYKIMVNSSNQGTPYVVEKIRPFKVAQRVTSLEIGQNAVYAGSPFGGFARIAFDRCDQYFLCSTCVAARDPFCLWNTEKGRCVSTLKNKNDKNIQDIIHGDSSKCPPISGAISCSLQILEAYPGAKTTLQCTANGFPSPSVIGWTKKDSRLVVDGDRFVTRNVSNTQQQLIISNYTLEDVGEYRCVVARGNITATCHNVLVGSEPVVNCSQAGPRCRCSVAGVPRPKIMKLVTGKLISVEGKIPELLPAGVSLFAVSGFGQAGFTCLIPTEQPTQPPTTAATTSTRRSTSSTTVTPTTAAAPTTTTHARPTAGPVPRQACPGCACVSYVTPLIVVSVLFVIMTLLCGALIAVLFWARVHRYNMDEEGEFSNDSDRVDGRPKICVVNFKRKSSRRPSKKRNDAIRNESRKSLIRNSSNDSNQVYKPTVLEMNHKNNKGATGNHHNDKPKS